MLEATQALEAQRIGSEHDQCLSRFFESLDEQGVGRYFHPHPFDSPTARRLANYQGQDLYYVFTWRGVIVAYGMLRGWDEGYDVPSLGLVVHREFRGMGLGRAMMEFLHASARLRGAGRIRLKVYAANVQAVDLYRSMGYEFRGEENGQLVAFLEL